MNEFSAGYSGDRRLSREIMRIFVLEQSCGSGAGLRITYGRRRVAGRRQPHPPNVHQKNLEIGLVAYFLH